MIKTTLALFLMTTAVAAQDYVEEKSFRQYYGPVTSARYFDGGRKIVSSGKDKLLKIWSSEGKFLRELRGHNDWILDIEVNGSQAVTASMDGGLIVWNLDSATASRRIGISSNEFNYPLCVAFHPDGNRVACGMRDGMVIEFNPATGEKLFEGRAAHRIANDVAYSPDGKYLAGTGHEIVTLWEVETGKKAMELGGHEQSDVTCVSFSADSRNVATGGTDNAIRIHDIAKKRVLRVLEVHEDPVLCVRFDNGGKYLASGGSDARCFIFDYRTGKRVSEIDRHKISVHSVDFRPDDQHVVTASLDSTMRVTATRSGKELMKKQGHGGFLYSIEYSPDKKLLAAAGVEYSVKMWNTRNYELDTELAMDWDDTIYRIAFNPDRPKEIAVGHKNGKIKQWIHTREAIQNEMLAHRGKVWGLAFVKRGKYLVSGGEDSYVLIWNTNTKRLLKTVGHDSIVRGVAAHPTKPMFASCDEVGLVQIWTIQERRRNWKSKFIDAHEGVVTSVRFSPDGKTLATSGDDGRVNLFDVESGKRIQSFSGHQGEVTMVEFHPDGKHLASSGKDKTVRIWKIGNEEAVQVLKGYKDEVSCLDYSPDGRHLATGAWDGEIKIWRQK